MASPGKFIPLSDEQEVFIIGDIHGCLNTLTSLLEKINYKGGSPLFFLGDYINKGPRSKETLDFLIDLCQQYTTIFPLLGNHDSYLLSFLTRTDPAWLQSEQYTFMLKNGDFVDLSPAEKSKYVSFLSSLPFYYETENAFLVHAGFNFGQENVLEDMWSMLNTREFTYRPEKLKHKKVIHGHLPHSISEIKKAVSRSAPVIPLDNGCVYEGERDGMGSLCCLELRQMELIAVSNSDKKILERQVKGG